MLDITELVTTAKEYGMTGVAITDHGNVMGVIDFYKQCTENDIKPILGCEIYLTEDMSIKSRREMEELNYDTYHLILYAKDDTGLGNLYALASAAGNDGYFDGYERIDLNYIKKHNLAEGLICTSACIGGPVASWLHTNKDKDGNDRHEIDRPRAEKWVSDLKETFEEFYIELGVNTLPLQAIVNQELMDIANSYNIPLIVSGDTHYLKQDDANIHEVLLTISTNTILKDPNRFKFPSNDFYLLTPKEVYDYCIINNIPLSAMENTVKIVDSCNANPMPKTKTGLLPPYPVDEEYDEDTYLQKLTFDNLIKLATRKSIDYITYANRLTYELNILASKGYSGYFLILEDLISFCERDSKIFTASFIDLWFKEKGYPEKRILTGPGRGSAAGSLVSYLTGITTLDPIEHGLIFERFLNPEKDAFPDIDTDFEDIRRQEVIDYIMWKYGVENTAAIITYGKMKLRSGIRRIMKSLGYLSTEIDEVAKSVPEKMPDQSAPDLQLFRDIRDNPQSFLGDYGDKLESVKNKVKVFWDFMAKYPDVEEILYRLEGTILNYSVHAAGIIVTPPGMLTKSIPTKYFDNSIVPVSQFDMNTIDKIKALKLDILGLKTLSVISQTCDLAGIDTRILDIENYDDYPEVYQVIRDGLTKQVFQLSSPGMTTMCNSINIENFEELTDAIALYRPGPLGAKDESTGLTMVDSYKGAKQDGTEIHIHKDIDPLLERTKGCLVYQEQVIEISQIISGYTLGSADLKIRKPIGKKLTNLFPSIRQEFVYGNEEVPGAIKRGYTEEFGNSLFDMIVKFGGYGFNRSHSACYADLSWKTAYLKAHYPAEYMASVMSVYHSDTDNIIDCIVESKKMGVDVLPPHINYSGVGFTIEEPEENKKAIRYGFTAIKGIGFPAAEEIIKYRPYTSFEDFMQKVHDPSIKRFKPDGKRATNPLSKRNEPVLIYAGSFDDFKENRYELYNNYLDIRKEKDPKYQNEKNYDRKTKLELELEHMGLYISDHPLKNYPFTRWSDWEDGSKSEIGGIVRKVEVKTNKRGNTFVTGTLETLEDKRRFIIHDKVYAKVSSKIKKDERIVIIGYKNDEYNNINVTDVKLIKYMKKKTEPEIEEPMYVDPSIFGGDDNAPREL